MGFVVEYFQLKSTFKKKNLQVMKTIDVGEGEEHAGEGKSATRLYFTSVLLRKRKVHL